jgi:CubicO group peptidase (beta-lactamase class C family)
MCINMKVKLLDQWVEHYCQQHPFSGIIRLTLRDEPIFLRCIGYANLEHQVPITPKTCFRFYSLTKPFCAIAALLLCERGLLNLSAHPNRYLPQITFLHPAVTLLSLLWHTSGIPDFSCSDAYQKLQYHNPFVAADWLNSISSLPIHFMPGTAFEYANVNYFLASLVIEAVTGEPFGQFIEREVFGALGMATAIMDEPARLVPHRASGYEMNQNGFIAAPPVNIAWLQGAGAAIGTVDDVYQLNKAIKNRQLLNEASWRQILTTSGLADYGLGCSVQVRDGKTHIQHNGAYYGFRTLHLQIVEDDFDLILLSNLGFGNIREEIKAVVHDIWYGQASA